MASGDIHKEGKEGRRRDRQREAGPDSHREMKGRIKTMA